jgi:hypothetical protein
MNIEYSEEMFPVYCAVAWLSGIFFKKVAESFEYNILSDVLDRDRLNA